jgi:hypothetical protein
MNTLRCAFALLLIASTHVQAQLSIDQDVDLTIRRSSNGAQYSKPALFSYTKPDDASASYAIDTALGLNYRFLDPVGARFQGRLSLIAEAHRNTATNSKQNKNLLGLGAAAQFNLDNQREWSLLPDLQVLSQRDEEGDTRGIDLNLNLRVRSKLLGIGDVFGPDLFPFEYEPVLGLQYSRQRDEAGARGRVSRYFGAVTINAYPGGFIVDRGWRIYYTGIRWQEMAESGFLVDARKRQYFREVGISYHFHKNFSIGVRHISGENPAEGLSREKFTQASLEVFF